MHFVDDINLETGGNGGIAHAFNNLADIINAGAAGGIHLHHIHMAGFGDGPAIVTSAAGGYGWPAGAVRPDTIQGLGNDAGGGGLANSAHPGQDKGMGQPSGFNGIGQGADHGVLTDQLIKIYRPVFPGQYAVILIVFIWVVI